MFKFLHAADIHLDSPLHRLESYEGAPVEELRRATRRAFENLVRLAVAEKAAFVLIAGDLYDGDWRDYNTGLYLVSQLGLLREAGIRVCIVAGNHDAANRMTRTLRLPESVTLFPPGGPETVTLDDCGAAVHGRSYPSPAVTANLAAGYPPALAGHFNIGLLHTCATGREGHEPYAPCTADDLRSKGYDYWALGHVHQQEEVLSDPLAVFPGNTQGRHARETGPKGCMLVTVDDRGRAGAVFRPLDVIRWERIAVDATGLDTGYDVVDAAAAGLEQALEQAGGRPLIARVEVSGGCRAHEDLGSDPERWTSEVRAAAADSTGGQVWVEKVKLETQPPAGDGARTPVAGPVGELLRHLDEVREDPDRLLALGEVLADLEKKLPRELREDPGAPAADREAWLAEVLTQVRPLLLRRLAGEGDEP